MCYWRIDAVVNAFDREQDRQIAARPKIESVVASDVVDVRRYGDGERDEVDIRRKV